MVMIITPLGRARNVLRMHENARELNISVWAGTYFKPRKSLYEAEMSLRGNVLGERFLSIVSEESH